MSKTTRREALKQLGAAGAAFALTPIVWRGQGADLMLAGRPGQIVISGVNAVTTRIVIQQTNVSDATLQDGALLERGWRGPVTRNAASASVARVPGTNVDVAIDVNPLRISVRSGSRTWQQLTIDPDSGSLTFPLGEKPVLGFGEGGAQFDRRGVVDRMRSGQGQGLATQGARVPIQWLIGTGGYALYIHRPIGTFDLTTATAKFDPAGPPPAAQANRPPPTSAEAPPESPKFPIDLFVVASDDPATIMNAWKDITGAPEMPARWTLGYLQSHRTLNGADDVRWVAKTMREKQLPCDALIYLGTDFTPSGWNTHNGEFSWNPANFPDPPAMIKELHDAHYKVVLHIVIEGRKLTGTVNDPCTAAPLPPGRVPDAKGQWPNEREVSCYWPAHKPLFDLGIDGWWPDQGDGFDGASRLARIRMYWDGSRMYRPNERPFALHRNGYAGMQRYAAFLWSGDVSSSWETLKTHVPNAINTSLSGIPLWGTDIGGFVPARDYTGELYARWFQFGAFCPLFRCHGRDWHLHLPWGWNLGEIGPIETPGYNPDPAELHNAAIEPVCKKYLELRYRLLPYLYSAVHEGTTTGLPIVRALWLHYADDPIATARGDEYLWGRDMLVAPVVEKGATSRKVYLPKGRWYDFWTEEATDGGREIDRAVDLATMPIFVRAGAIVPMDPVRQYTSQPVTDPSTLTIYPGADGNSLLYDDDGESFAYKSGGWMGVRMRWTDAARRLTLSLEPGSKMIGASRAFDVRVAGTKAVKKVTFTGATQTITL